MEDVIKDLEKEYSEEDSSDESNDLIKLNIEKSNKDGNVDVSEETLIAFAREVTKRLEITKRYDYDILKLKLEHALEIKKNGYFNVM